MQTPHSLADDVYGLLSPEIFFNPYGTYHLLRYEDPIHWSELLGCWVLTRYKDIHSILRDRRLSSARRRPAATATLPEPAREKMLPIDNFLSMWMLNTDPPEHTRLRALVNQHFTQREVAKLRPRIQSAVDELLDTVIETGSMDVVADFAYPLPITIITELLGVPARDRARLVSWFKSMAMYFQVGPARMEILDAMSRSISEVKEYLHHLADEARLHPRDDLLSKLVASGQLSPQQLLSMCVLLLFSGHESTAALIGTSILALLQHPDQLRLLISAPTLLPSAIEEFLRFDGPFIRQDRVVTADIELDGKLLKAGERVILVLGAANHDPAKFYAPDDLDIRRQDNEHLAFGNGAHFCLGSQLARLEAQISIGTALRRLPGLRLQSDDIQWREHYNHRGLLTLPVAFNPGERQRGAVSAPC